MKVLCAFTVLLCVAAIAEEQPGQDQFDFANGLFQRSFYDEAADEYRNYLKEYPNGQDAAMAWYRLGVCENTLKHNKEALEAFTEAARLGDQDSIATRAILGKGEALYGLKKLDEAAAVFKDLTSKNIDKKRRKTDERDA